MLNGTSKLSVRSVGASEVAMLRRLSMITRTTQGALLEDAIGLLWQTYVDDQIVEADDAPSSDLNPFST